MSLLQQLKYLSSALVGIEIVKDNKPVEVGIARQADGSQRHNVEQLTGLGTYEIVETIPHNVASQQISFSFFRLRHRDLRRAGVIGYGEEVLRLGVLNCRIFDKAGGTLLYLEGLILSDNRFSFVAGRTPTEDVTFFFTKATLGADAPATPPQAQAPGLARSA